MLQALWIQDFALIRRQDLILGDGFTALTGETGGGKSILLDALGAALGAKVDKRLVRAGAEQAVATAAFAPPAGHAVWALLHEKGVAATADEPLIFKRILPSDGPARAYVNDQPAAAALLQEAGALLVDIHAQHAAAALTRPSSHLEALDAFAGAGGLRARCAEAWTAARQAADRLLTLETETGAAMREQAELRALVEDIDALDPEPDEAAALAAARSRGLQTERAAGAVAEARAALDASRPEDALADAWRSIDRLRRVPGYEAGETGGAARAAAEAADALERAMAEAADAGARLEALASDIEHDADALAGAEDRLFALRAAARRYEIEPDALIEARRVAAERLAALDADEEAVETARAAAREASARWRAAADALSRARQAAAGRLDAAVMAELKPLKLGGVRFKTMLGPVEPGEEGPSGIDAAMFEVATNKGAGFWPLQKIASGGELARVSLALRCALAGADRGKTLVFDEADQGVGGATAAAIGERLARLGETRQVLAVTHSPQVAASAAAQWRIEKTAPKTGLGETRASALNDTARREEIARMLSGAKITEEARAAAVRLLEG